MATIKYFPINTSDQWANESILGLCSPLCASLSLTNPSSGYVVSEYGARQGINQYIEDHINPVNLGVGEGIFADVDANIVQLKSLTANNNSRFTFEVENGDILIGYDGRGGGLIVNSEYVQGGNKTLELNVSAFDGSGRSTTSVEILANVVNDLDAYTDVAIGKIGIRIPSGNAFPNENEVIHIGTPSNNKQFGYFLTKNSTQIVADGEWQPLIYSSGMYVDQFEYFISNTNIYAYTSGATLNSGTNFDVRIWYDNVNYNSVDDEEIIIDSVLNSQTNTIDRTIVGDGFIEVRWFDGEYLDQFTNILTNFNVFNDSDSIEFYGNKDNRIRMAVSDGDTISLYISSNNSALNNGNITIKYTKETF